MALATSAGSIPLISEKCFTLIEKPTLEESRAARKGDSKCSVFTWWINEGVTSKTRLARGILKPTGKLLRQAGKLARLAFGQGAGYKPSDEDLLWHLETQNAEECRQRCAFMEDCTVFTFDAASTECFMLSVTDEDVEDESLRSGPAKCTTDTSCFSKNVMLEHTTNMVTTDDQPDSEECQTLCSAVPKCRFFTFDFPLKRCYLKTGYLGEGILTAESSTFTSGPKKC